MLLQQHVGLAKAVTRRNVQKWCQHNDERKHEFRGAEKSFSLEIARRRVGVRRLDARAAGTEEGENGGERGRERETERETETETA